MATSSYLARVARRFRFSALAFTLFAMAAVAYAITAYAGYRGVREMAALDDARQHESTTLLLLQRTLGTLVDLETGQRGFILSGRDEFLQPFVTARAELQRLQPSLGAYIDGSGSAPVRTMRPVIDRLIAQRVAAAEETIERRRENDYEPRRDLVDHIRAKQLMDDLRSAFATLEAYQTAVLERRRNDSEDVAAATSTLVGALTAGGSVLMGGALWLLWRERRLRDEADAALRVAHERLEHQVTERTEALSEAMVRIQSFAGQLDHRIEEERRRLSREVHDQLGQIATVAKLVVGDLARAHPELPEEHVGQITGLLDEAIRIIRRIAGELRPPMLDDLGLGAAASHHVRSVAALGKLDTRVEVAGDEHLPPDRANQIFRILQEATTNVLRHAGATHLVVRGRVEGRHYRFDVEDDGVGPADMRADASGVRNMRERAALVGGSLQFGPGPHGGTRVTVRVPLETVPS